MKKKMKIKNQLFIKSIFQDKLVLKLIQNLRKIKKLVIVQLMRRQRKVWNKDNLKEQILFKKIFKILIGKLIGRKHSIFRILVMIIIDN